MQVDIRHNIAEFSGWLRTLHHDQVPFATSQALNSTVFDVRKHVVGRTFPEAFTLRNRRFPSAVLRVVKARKRRLVARLHDPKQRAWIERQATGGTKRARGRFVAVPDADIVRRTASGKIRAADKPRRITSKRGTFISKGGGKLAPGIWRRNAASGRVQPVYVFRPAVRIPKRLRFYEDASKVVASRFPRRFRQAFIKAVRTAR
jgi:hypothetical protein